MKRDNTLFFIIFAGVLAGAFASLLAPANAGFQDSQHFYGNLTGTPNGSQAYIYVVPAPSAGAGGTLNVNAQVTVTVNNVIQPVPILTSTAGPGSSLAVALTPTSLGTPDASRVFTRRHWDAGADTPVLIAGSSADAVAGKGYVIPVNGNENNSVASHPELQWWAVKFSGGTGQPTPNATPFNLTWVEAHTP